MRLIDVDALKKDYHMADDCKDCKTNVRDCEYDHVYIKMDFCGWLDDAPTVDAVPVVHGRWIKKDGSIATCSICGDRWGVWSVMRHCPSCGAKMDGKDGDNRD